MDFLNFIKQESQAFNNRLLFLFLLTGLLHFLILASILYSINSIDHPSTRHLVLFVISIYAYIRLDEYSLNRTSEIIEEIVAQIRVRLTDKVRRADLIALETLGSGPIYTALTTYTTTIADAAKLISRLVISGALLVIASLYIAWLSSSGFLFITAMVMLSVFIYRQVESSYEETFRLAEEKETGFFHLLNHLLFGFKELKLNDAKNNDLYKNHITVKTREAEELRSEAFKRMTRMIIFAQIFCYTILGSLIFVYPKIVDEKPSILLQLIALVLFIASGPLQEAMGTFPFLERANAAVRNIRDLESKLETILPEPLANNGNGMEPMPDEDFETLKLSQISFEYGHMRVDSPFQVGPIDLEIKKGEIVFLMGGNGAGKSTLLKVLTGLYHASSGAIYCNGRAVTRHNISWYRSYFTAVFQDFHLFDRLYGVEQADFGMIRDWLARLQLDHKTKVNADLSFQTLDLSAGQKKRIALLTAELDDREIYVFDEWAADQDPPFRKYFYETYLQELKSRGKTIIAVTHDDKYYHTADRIYNVSFGRLTEYAPTPVTPAKPDRRGRK
ncbi:MAG: cyclic peptide export ABC transporter [bacterium]|nr:cyclic peptide export ABC transporter [bacterium]